MQDKPLLVIKSLTAEQAAIVKLAINLMICSVDWYPGLGLALPALANLTKFAKRYDLTPDVPKLVAFTFLGIEIPLAGTPFLYTAMTAWQLFADARRYHWPSRIWRWNKEKGGKKSEK